MRFSIFLYTKLWVSLMQLDMRSTKYHDRKGIVLLLSKRDASVFYSDHVCRVLLWLLPFLCFKQLTNDKTVYILVWAENTMFNSEFTLSPHCEIWILRLVFMKNVTYSWQLAPTSLRLSALIGWLHCVEQIESCVPFKIQVTLGE